MKKTDRELAVVALVVVVDDISVLCVCVRYRILMRWELAALVYL